MLFYYIRHADPIYKPDSLTPLGQRQAEALSRRLSTYGFDKIFASSSTRAQMTAQPTCDVLKMSFAELDWCNEHYAFMELSQMEENGKRTWAFAHKDTREKFHRPEVREAGREWYEHEYFNDTKFKEGILRIQNESDALLESLGYKHDHERYGYIPIVPNEERVALFAHQGFGLAFLSCILDIPYPVLSTRFDLGHSSVTVIEFKNGGDIVYPTVITLSNDSHLYRDGLPTKFQNRIHI